MFKHKSFFWRIALSSNMSRERKSKIGSTGKKRRQLNALGPIAESRTTKCIQIN